MSTLTHLEAHRSAVVAVSVSQPPCNRVLAGLIERGYGREACAAYLGITEAQLMVRVVHLDLPTPTDCPMRSGSGPNAWTVDAVQRLIDLWIRDLAVARIAEWIGRSPASIRSKARRLGLYRRDRSGLLTALPLFPEIDATPKRHQLVWTDELERWLADRWFSYQHHKAIARDLGAMLGCEVSYTTVASKAHRLELPKRDAHFLLDDYKADYRARHARLLPRMIERRCKIRGRLFWSTGVTYTSDEAKAQAAYRTICAGVSDHALAAMH